MKPSRTRLLTAGVMTGTVALTAAGVSAAEAATTPPPLAIVAATTHVTADRYESDGEVQIFLDLGLHAIAGNDAFEIRARRSGYDKPITAERIVTQKGKKKAVALPAGLVTDFSGLKDFVTITFTDTTGMTVREHTTGFCGNGYESETTRTRPDAPATNPYPTDCGGGNPFALGAVWGVQAGWNTRLTELPDELDEPFDLAAGEYTATVTMNPKYQKAFDVPAQYATAQVKVDIVDAPEEWNRAAAVEPEAKVAPAGHDLHSGEGDASRQVSSRLPEFRAAAKRPTSLKTVPSGPKPDLKSLPAWGISLSEEDGKQYVNFGATVWNAGTSPLLVDGFRRTGTELMDAYQYFFDAKGNQVGSKQAGTMEWDPREGHFHWHFTDFAQYNLLAADQKLAVRSGKESFCLANTDAVDYTIPGAKWRPENTSLETSCGANTVVAVREVLDVGSGDTYSQDRPGQSFEITDLPNGTYYIQVLANPDKKLAELSLTNNSALREIVLGGTPEERTLTVPPVHGIEG